MKKIVVRVAVGAVASGLLGANAVAQDMSEITVQGTRMVTAKTLGRTSSSVPISAVSLSYNVSVKDLDLASHAGFVEAEKRVKTVADTACKELAKLYPDAKPTVAECSKAAADKVMVIINGWSERASKGAPK